MDIVQELPLSHKCSGVAPVPTPGRHDKLIVTPFPSPCGAPGSTQPVQETDTRGETRFLS